MPAFTCHHLRATVGLDHTYCPDCHRSWADYHTFLKSIPRAGLPELSPVPPAGPPAASSPPSAGGNGSGRTSRGNGSPAHGVELYWVKHKDFYYFRYWWSEGKRIRRTHIPGGSTSNPTARARAENVRIWINQGHPPDKITAAIAKWKVRQPGKR